jgi:hypothetical protein
MRKKAKAKHSSAASRDGWKMKHFSLLPYGAFCPLAVLGEHVFSKTKRDTMLPSILVSARVWLIDKFPGLRPITILSALWRLWCGEVLCHHLEWIETWRHEDLGALPGSETHDILEDFEVSLDLALLGKADGEVDLEVLPLLCGFSQDQSACFCRTSWKATLTFARYVGFNIGAIDAVWAFYSQCSQQVQTQHSVAPIEIGRKTGLFQGCGLSLMLLMRINALWRLYVKNRCNNVILKAWVDDRLGWALGPTAKEDTILAVAATKQFDAALKWKQNNLKSYCFTTQVAVAQDLAFGTGMPSKTEFTYLGTDFDLSLAGNIRQTNFTMPKKIIAKVNRRCQRIRIAVQQSKHRRFQVKRMVLPLFKYSAQWRRRLAKQNMNCVIERCVLPNGKIWKGRSPALMWCNVLGFQLSPDYTELFEVFASRVRSIRKKVIRGLPMVFPQSLLGVHVLVGVRLTLSTLTRIEVESTLVGSQRKVWKLLLLKLGRNHCFSMTTVATWTPILMHSLFSKLTSFMEMKAMISCTGGSLSVAHLISVTFKR